MLQAAGFAVRADVGSATLPAGVRPPRSREAARAAFAQALSLLPGTGGVLVVLAKPTRKARV
ncbi:MAG: hypothetical protein IPH76_07060 [Xanthomonadales bacterium]|nr:hypothetical protein [Xanthomonadales bacterium]